MGQGRFRTEEELVIDSVGLRLSGIRRRSRGTWLLVKGGRRDRAERSWGGAGRGEEGGAGELSEAGLCADGPSQGGACADSRPGRDRVRLGDCSRAPDPPLRGWRVGCCAW